MKTWHPRRGAQHLQDDSYIEKKRRFLERLEKEFIPMQDESGFVEALKILKPGIEAEELKKWILQFRSAIAERQNSPI